MIAGFALILLATLTLISTSVGPALASQPPFDTTIVAGGGARTLGGDWLQSPGVVNKGGVDVYSNGSISTVTNDYSSPAIGMRWQCVELVQRLYRVEGWTNDSNQIWGVNAVGIYGLGGRNLKSEPNDGRYVPVPGDMIVHSGNGGTGHVAAVNYVSGSTVYVIEQNVDLSAETAPGQASYSIGSNLVLTRNQPVANTPIVGIVHSGYNNNTNPGYSYKNGTVLHNLGTDAVYVWAGGAKFVEASLTELSQLGYSTNYPGMKDISDATATAAPTVPANGTVLRSNTSENIYVVAGGAKFVFGSWGEYTQQGYSGSSYTNVPQTPLNAIGDAPGNMPKNGTVVQRPGGSLYVIAGGVRWPFSSMSQYYSLGYMDAQIVRVSQGPLDGIYDASASHLPANETLLQGSDSTIWVMKSGQRRSFISAAQFNSYGYSWSSIVRVPDGVLSGIPNGGNLP